MPVDTKHREYNDAIQEWLKVRDCVNGASAVKARTVGGTLAGDSSNSLKAMGGTRYLPAPNPTDSSKENRERYVSYKLRAIFSNYTAATLEGLCGMQFRAEPTIELAPNLQYMELDCNGNGMRLVQFARDLVSEVLQTGRYGVLVDYPDAPESVSLADMQTMYMRANLCGYKAESILNWRTVMVGGVRRLSMVVLEECAEEIEEDGFGVKTSKQYRVLELSAGVYSVTLYNEDGDQVGEIQYPRKADGSAWQEIPFEFIGALNNDETTDRAPLADIAEVNLGHYRNSADYEESSHLVGQPTAVIFGLSQSWVDTVLKDGVMLGSRRALLLPEGGGAALLQAASNQMPERGMEQKEAQMIALGARLITPQGGTETAEAARIRFAGQTSKLAGIAGNIEDGIIKCLKWAGWFMGGEGESNFALTRDYYDAKLDPQRIMAEIQLLDRGVIGVSDVRDNLRKGNALDRTDDEIDADMVDPML